MIVLARRSARSLFGENGLRLSFIVGFLDFCMSPPIPPRPLSTPAGAERGSLIWWLVSGYGITGARLRGFCSGARPWRGCSRGLGALWCRAGCGSRRNDERARAKVVSSLRAPARKQPRATKVSLTLEPQRRGRACLQKARNLPKVIPYSEREVKSRLPLSAPAGVERGRGVIGGGIHNFKNPTLKSSANKGEKL